MDIRPGATLVGPNGATITIESVIGRGGFGQVFLGRLPDATPVAVKTVLTAGLSDSELLVFQNEAKHAVGLNHPNVVRVLYVDDGEGDEGQPPYLVMEYVDGGTLRRVIEAHRSGGSAIPVDELRAMYLQIAEGMSAVNERLVHRDLKPDNVLVDATNRRLKIADFGLAKLVDAATRSETFKGWGTRPYQAPEAFEAGPNTPAMDVYAAGVLFYELATLMWPLQPNAGDNTPMAWRNAHLLKAPSDIRAVRPGFPLDLVQLTLQMLHKDPKRRPASFADIAKRLGTPRVAAGQPDVEALVQKATSTFVERTEAETRAREERERGAERRALLEQAFQEPLGILRTLVEAFNAASSVAKLEIRLPGPLSAEVRSDVSGGMRLVLNGQIVGDMDTRRGGIVRIMALAQLEPNPRPRTPDDLTYDRDSFGSFNLVYRVPRQIERFGEWAQLRFEVNPLMRETAFPRWFAMEFDELPRQLQLLGAVGRFQYEQRSLDGEWFKALLVQIL